MATLRPAAVVIRASEIPPARLPALPTPASWISANTLIIPITVPNRPSSGVMVAMVPRVQEPFQLVDNLAGFVFDAFFHDLTAMLGIDQTTGQNPAQRRGALQGFELATVKLFF